MIDIEVHLNTKLLVLFLRHASGDATTAGHLINLSLIDGLRRIGISELDLIQAGVSQRTIDEIKKFEEFAC